MNDPLYSVITHLIRPTQKSLRFEDLNEHEKLKIEDISKYLLKASREGLKECEIPKKYLSKKILEVLENELSVSAKVWLGDGDVILEW